MPNGMLGSESMEGRVADMHQRGIPQEELDRVVDQDLIDQYPELAATFGKEKVYNAALPFNTVGQIAAYTALMRKQLVYYEAMNAEERAEYNKKYGDIVSSVKQYIPTVIDKLGYMMPERADLEEAEKFLGIPTWFHKGKDYYGHIFTGEGEPKSMLGMGGQ